MLVRSTEMELGISVSNDTLAWKSRLIIIKKIITRIIKKIGNTWQSRSLLFERHGRGGVKVERRIRRSPALSPRHYGGLCWWTVTAIVVGRPSFVSVQLGNTKMAAGPSNFRRAHRSRNFSRQRTAFVTAWLVHGVPVTFDRFEVRHRFCTAKRCVLGTRALSSWKANGSESRSNGNEVIVWR